MINKLNNYLDRFSCWNWLNKLVYSWLIDDSNKFCPTESKQWWSTNSARMKVNSTQSLLECIESKNMIFIIVIGVLEHSRWCTWINKQMLQHSELSTLPHLFDKSQNAYISHGPHQSDFNMTYLTKYWSDVEKDNFIKFLHLILV